MLRDETNKQSLSRLLLCGTSTQTAFVGKGAAHNYAGRTASVITGTLLVTAIVTAVLDLILSLMVYDAGSTTHHWFPSVDRSIAPNSDHSLSPLVRCLCAICLSALGMRHVMSLVLSTQLMNPFLHESLSLRYLGFNNLHQWETLRRAYFSRFLTDQLSSHHLGSVDSDKSPSNTSAAGPRGSNHRKNRDALVETQTLSETGGLLMERDSAEERRVTNLDVFQKEAMRLKMRQRLPLTLQCQSKLDIYESVNRPRQCPECGGFTDNHAEWLALHLHYFTQSDRLAAHSASLKPMTGLCCLSIKGWVYCRIITSAVLKLLFHLVSYVGYLIESVLIVDVSILNSHIRNVSPLSVVPSDDPKMCRCLENIVSEPLPPSDGHLKIDSCTVSECGRNGICQSTDTLRLSNPFLDLTRFFIHFESLWFFAVSSLIICLCTLYQSHSAFLWTVSLISFLFSAALIIATSMLHELQKYQPNYVMNVVMDGDHCRVYPPMCRPVLVDPVLSLLRSHSIDISMNDRVSDDYQTMNMNDDILCVFVNLIGLSDRSQTTVIVWKNVWRLLVLFSLDLLVRTSTLVCLIVFIWDALVMSEDSNGLMSALRECSGQRGRSVWISTATVYGASVLCSMLLSLWMIRQHGFQQWWDNKLTVSKRVSYALPNPLAETFDIEPILGWLMRNLVWYFSFLVSNQVSGVSVAWLLRPCLVPLEVAQCAVDHDPRTQEDQSADVHPAERGDRFGLESDGSSHRSSKEPSQIRSVWAQLTLADFTVRYLACVVCTPLLVWDIQSRDESGGFPARSSPVILTFLCIVVLIGSSLTCLYLLSGMVDSSLFRLEAGWLQRRRKEGWRVTKLGYWQFDLGRVVSHSREVPTESQPARNAHIHQVIRSTHKQQSDFAHETATVQSTRLQR